MAKFRIISRDGETVRYEGKLSYHGTYLQPSYVEFREIASDVTIPWEVGDYVDYERTGLRYRLYAIPEIVQNSSRKRTEEEPNARLCKEKVVYSNVKFYAPTKALEQALFLDLVIVDNRIHFSTQKDISTFEDVAGIARRIQSCLDYAFPNDGWLVECDPSLASSVPIVTEAREFTMSAGQTVLEALDKVYETWENVGWTYSLRNGRNVITIGGANTQTVGNTVLGGKVGKGNGLKQLRISVANGSDLCTRLYAYGSSDNLPSRYYNNLDIKDAESVDIQHLMIPLDKWGKTDGKPDASKAYLEASREALDFLGVHPKVIYFDGEEYGKFCPSIEGMTIGDVRRGKDETRDMAYYPKENIYRNPDERVDLLKGAAESFDDGVVDSKAYSSNTNGPCDGYFSGTLYGPGTLELGSMTSHVARVAVVYGNYPSLELASDVIATVHASSTATIKATLTVKDDLSRLSNTFEVPLKVSQTDDAETYGLSVPDGTRISHDEFFKTIEHEAGTSGYMYFFIKVEVTDTAGQKYVRMKNNVSVKMLSGNEPYDYVYLKQIGFNIADQRARRTGAIGTLEMKTGMCAGRSFPIVSATYAEESDSWVLKIKRMMDKSLMMVFPNTTYSVGAGDQFVLTDITMPSIYVSAQENRLYRRAQEVLAELSKPILMIEPSVDAKYAHEHPQFFLEGRYFDFESDVLDDTYLGLWNYSKLIDTVTINENEEAIPTISLTLREKKHRSFREVSYSTATSSSSSSNTEEVGTTSGSTSVGGEGIPGPQGPQGPMGPQGPVGPAGRDGADGKDGKDGVGVVFLEQTTASTESGGLNVITEKLSNGYVTTFNVYNGQEGKQGKQGPRGDVGPQGKQGIQGIQGPVGPGATIRVGYVSVGDLPSANVTNRGTATDAILDFTLPRIDGEDYVARIKAAPKVSIKKGHYANGIDTYDTIFVDHPSIREVRNAEVVLMVYRKCNSKVVGIDHMTGSKIRRRVKGWAVATGDTAVFGHTAFTSNFELVDTDDVRDFLVKRFMYWSGKTQDEMKRMTYADWHQSGDIVRGFKAKGTGAFSNNKLFGLAVRIPNPAFENYVDGPLSDATQEINGAPRYIYSEVVPLVATLNGKDVGVNDKAVIAFSLVR